MLTLGVAVLIFGVLCMGAFVLTLAVSDFRARQERLRRGRARVADIIESTTCDTDAEIIAVAEQAFAERPELFDDDAATVLRALAATDGAEAAFVTPGCAVVDALLAEAFPRGDR